MLNKMLDNRIIKRIPTRLSIKAKSKSASPAVKVNISAIFFLPDKIFSWPKTILAE